MDKQIIERAVEAAAKANFDRYTDHPHGDAWEETPEQVKAIWRGGVTEPVTAALAEVEASITAERDRLAERLDKLLGVADEDGVTYPPNEFQRALRRYAAFEYDNLVAERDDLAARVARAEALHYEFEDGGGCHECDWDMAQGYPCPTLKALRGES